jgi:VCBS repeat protein
MDVVETARGRRGWFSRWIPFRSGALLVLGCSLAALLAGGVSAADPTFTQAPGSPIATGSGAISVVAANLNGAGGLDLAVANQGANNVSILLGNGNGTFVAPTNFAVGTDPVAVVAADLNGAGGLDLAVANENATGLGSVSILLGNGSGSFSPAAGSPVTTGPTGSAPQAIAVADLNGAGGLDLAVVNEGTDNVTILLGNGSGSFSPAAGSPVTVGSLPQAIAVANLNGAGGLDLAVVNEGTSNVSILLGNGTGGFTPGSPVSTGAAPSDVGTADVNADGKADLIVANTDGNSVSILLGDGLGAFANSTGSPVGVGTGPEGTAAADYNGDGKLDLAVANTGTPYPGNLTILLGNGTGAFTASASTILAEGAPTTVAAADLTGDTKPDLAVANYDTGNLTVQLNTTPATPTAVTLSNFVARSTRQGVELRWRTAQETGLIGFHVYRSGVKLNRTLITARGPGAAGAAYRLLDRRARIGAVSSYRLQAVRVNGTRAWLGRASTKR